MDTEEVKEDKKEEVKTNNVPHYEAKGVLSSKKFLAYLLADIGWKVILGFMIWHYQAGEGFLLMFSVIIVSGFVQTGFILGQSALDRYTRIAEITARVKEKAIDLGRPHDDVDNLEP